MAYEQARTKSRFIVGRIAGVVFIVLVALLFIKKDALLPTVRDRLAASPSQTAWKPEDPNEPTSTRPFDEDFLESVRRATSLDQFQRLLGSKGKITQRGERPTATYSWTYTRPEGLHDNAVLTVFPDGSYGGSIHTRERGDIIITSTGMFLCDGCQPPVHVCGSKPPWIAEREEWRDPQCKD